MSNSLKIYTCALKGFPSDDKFFARDSGLLCRHLQQVGVESKVVMPIWEDDPGNTHPDVIRAEQGQMLSPAWWQNLGADAVVVITWGYAKHTNIIQAIKASGTELVLIADGCVGQHWWNLLTTIVMSWRRRYNLPFWRKMLETGIRAPIAYLMLKRLRRGMWKQFKYADLISTVTPKFGKKLRTEFRRHDVVSNAVFLSGYPVGIREGSSGEQQNSHGPAIVAAARWDALFHKRPYFLMDVCRELLARHRDVVIHLYGKTIPYMQQVAETLPETQSARLFIHGFCEHALVLERLRESEVAICPSAVDGGPVPIAEALCAGCSVVGGGNFAQWAVDVGCGTPVAKDDPSSFADAVLNELEKWRAGAYQRDENAAFWVEHFSARRFAERVCELVRKGVHDGTA